MILFEFSFFSLDILPFIHSNSEGLSFLETHFLLQLLKSHLIVFHEGYKLNGFSEIRLTEINEFAAFSKLRIQKNITS